MDTITALVIGALATARVTRLVTTDRITLAPRRWLLRRLNQEGLLAYLVVCDWCASAYVGFLVAGTGSWAGLWSPWWVLPVALSFSYVAGWLASREGSE